MSYELYKKDHRKEKNNRLLLLSIAALLIALCTYTLFVPDLPEISEPPKDEFDAFAICHKFVEDELLAPSSAEFASSVDSDIRDLGNDSWRIHSYVESQNAFGVMIRSRYDCEVHFNTVENHWILFNLDFE
jgi:hypothetical protein